MSSAPPPPWATLVRAANPGPMTLDGTNTWVLRAPGATSAVVVDPGPLDGGHLEAVATHGPVELVLLTHSHPDHAEGARRFADLVGAPVAAADPAYVVEGELLRRAVTLEAGGLRIEARPTPGHTSDSVCFVVATTSAGEPVHAAVLTGDTVLGRGTTVVAHPDGVLADYLRSLELLAACAGARLLPGHGPVRDDVAEVASAYLVHRRERLDQVRSALASGAATTADVVDVVYADVDPGVRAAAELSVRAQLAYLRGASAHGVRAAD